MNEQQLCHWLLYQPDNKCRSVFAKPGDSCQGYYRVGPVAVSPQFVFPVVFAMHPSNIVMPAQVGIQSRKAQFEFLRDDRNQASPAFMGMPALKVATLISELTGAIAHWVGEVGAEFESLALIDGKLELAFKLEGASDANWVRSIELIKAGIEMMGYSRGLVTSNWII